MGRPHEQEQHSATSTWYVIIASRRQSRKYATRRRWFVVAQVYLAEGPKKNVLVLCALNCDLTVVGLQS
jgi:hypothetical protein